MVKLGIEPIKQQAWHLQVKDRIQISKRPIDKMSIAQIRKMYKDKKFLCDECGKLIGEVHFDLIDHITHMINPKEMWCCDDCIIKDIRNGRVIGEIESGTEKWQSDNI